MTNIPCRFQTSTFRQKGASETSEAIYTTNAIESLNSVIRKATKQRKIFPTDDSVMKVICLYADDFVCAFRYRDDAERFFRALPKRLGKFELEVAPEKTRLMRFSRF